jgi:hypothetical protein
MKPTTKLLLTFLLLTLHSSLWGLTLDEHHLLLDGSLTDEEVRARQFVYNDFREAVCHLKDTTTLYIRPWVYWVDNPDIPEVVKGEDGREPFGIVIHGKKLTLIGLGRKPEDVILASQRGQMQGAVGNFTMMDMHVEELIVENMTLGNYCNVDLDYPSHPSLSRKRRSDAITQAHVGYVHGRSLYAKNVRFISRLNLNPLNGARESVYDSCHFECTDDALNGTALYRHCEIDLYGQKPFWSTFGSGAMFVDCDFNVMGENREMYFCKQGGPVTLVDCRYHAPSDSIYIGWTAYPQRWLRCYQKNFTLNGKPYLIGSRQRENTIVMDSVEMNMTQPPYLAINRHEAEMQVGGEPLLLTVKGNGNKVVWHSHPIVTLSQMTGDSVWVSITCDDIEEPVSFPVTAVTTDGVAVCQVTVNPSQLPPPVFLKAPKIRVDREKAYLDYSLDLQGRRDESRITWYRDGIPVSTTHGEPQRSYPLTAADNGHTISASIEPKSSRSNYGFLVMEEGKIMQKLAPVSSMTTDFSNFPCQWQPQVIEGYWTVDGYKPLDTVDYIWSFDTKKPMWEYGEGFNGAVGKGLLQAQRGARLMYTPVKRTYDSMSMELQVDPTKTAGQGFGSATGQYMDICLKFDTHTLTGYGLRVIRTVKYAKAVDFLLVAYENGVVTPLTDPVSSTCYRTGCIITVNYADGQLSAHVETQTPKPAESDLPHQVDLRTRVTHNPFGGIHIQHTGSCGESTTMLHRLNVEWTK